ncbi:MAG: hypothetical protein ACTHMM_13435 [Agriterribacter sp.]
MAYLTAAAANNKLVTNDWKPVNTNVKVLLKRNGVTSIIMQDNLLLLGTFNTLKNGMHEFFNGLDKIYPAAGIKNVLVRPVELFFGSPIRVNPGDELVTEVSLAASGSFTANIDSSASYLEFYANPDVGYEVGIPKTTCEVVNAGTSKQPFNPGDGVTDIAVLNFDKDTLESEVITNLALSSDRYDIGLSFNQLVAAQVNQFAAMPAWRTGTTLPVTLAGQDVFRGLNRFPQSFLLVDSVELAQVRLDISFNTANVASSENWVVWRTIQATQEGIITGVNRREKHIKENFQKLPSR